MDFCVLGRVEVITGRRRMPLGSVQQRRLLGLLLAHPGDPVSVDRIIDALWRDTNAPAAPERTVQSYVSRLRGVVGDGRIVRRSIGYAIDLSGARLDAVEFEKAVRAARGRPHAEALAVLEGALSWWGGAPFGEFSEEPWTFGLSSRLIELRASALEDSFAARIALGGHREVIAELSAAVAEEPERTHLVGHLMVAHVRSGSQVAALRAFQTHRRCLADGSGLDPAPMLVELEQQILANDGAAHMPDAVPHIRGFELLDAVGSGIVGTVYRARQPVTDRVVAVKVIRADVAARPDFVKIFEARAQHVARFEHPHVATLYDFWREPDGAFLVYRLFVGGDLAQARAVGGPWPLEQTTRLVNELGSALAAGHRVGLVHGNLRDSNVLFDEEANAYVSDYPFGDSPGGVKATSASDCADLARLVCSVLAGRPALEHERGDAAGALGAVRRDLPEAIVAVLTSAQRRSPEAMGADVESWSDDPVGCFVRDWNEACAALGVNVRSVEHWTGENPYKGLRPFEEVDAADLFGRDQLVDNISNRLISQVFVAVVGPSGSGKSSLVRAGVIPRLRGAGWSIATMKPGEHPIESLVTALALAGVHGGRQRAAMPGDGLVRDRPIAERLRSGGAPLLLVIDQMEELFTLTRDDVERAAFIAALAEAVASDDGTLRVVAALRADFLSRPLHDPLLGHLFQESTVIVPAMTPRELDACIRGPAERRGLAVEPSLISQLVSDVSSRPGSLPLLQFALTDLFDRRASPILSLSTYDEVGGLGGALSRRAEAMYASLPATQRALLPELIARLVTSSEGHPETSRRVAVRDLPPAALDLVTTLVDERLMSTTHDPTTREPTVELAHESLLSEWSRVGQWLDESQDDVRIVRQLAAAATAWEHGGRTDSDLYRGVRLDAALEWRSRRLRSLVASEQSFLDESERDARRTTNQRERSLRLVRRLSAGLACLLAVAVTGAGVAVTQRQAAQRASYRAETKRLFATAAKLATEDPATAMLLAVEGSRRHGQQIDAQDSLLSVLTALPNSLGSVTLPLPLRHVLFDRSGKRLLGVGERGVVAVDVATHRVVHSRSLASMGTVAPSIALGPGSTVIVSDGQYDVRVLDDASLADVGSPLQLPGIGRVLATSPDGSTLAVGTDFGSVGLWDVRSRTRLGELLLPSRPVRLAFSPDGMRLAIGERNAVSLWNVRTRSETRRFPFPRALAALMFAGTGDTLIAGSEPVNGASIVAALDAATGTERWQNSRPGAAAPDLASEGPDAVLVADASGTRRVDVLSGDSEVLTTTPARSVANSPVGGPIVVVEDSPSLSLWSADGHGLLSETVPGSPGACPLQQSADGRYVACIRPLRIWESATSRPRLLISDDRSQGVLLSAGRALAIAPNGDWRIEDLRRGVVIEHGQSFLLSGGGPAGPGPILAASPNGRWLVVGDDSHLRALDFRRGAASMLVEPGPSRVGTDVSIRAAWFSPDGRSLLVEQRNGDVRRWPTGQWSQPSTLWFSGVEDGRRPIAFDDTSELVLTDATAGDAFIALSDRRTGTLRSVRFVGFRSTVSSAAFDTSGDSSQRWLATTELDGTVRLWDVRSQRAIGTAFHNSVEAAPLFLRGPTRRLVTAGVSKAFVWNLNPRTWVAIACEAAGRNLTRSEWSELGPRGKPYRPTCPQWQPHRAATLADARQGRP